MSASDHTDANASVASSDLCCASNTSSIDSAKVFDRLWKMAGDEALWLDGRYGSVLSSRLPLN